VSRLGGREVCVCHSTLSVARGRRRCSQNASAERQATHCFWLAPIRNLLAEQTRKTRRVILPSSHLPYRCRHGRTIGNKRKWPGKPVAVIRRPKLGPSTDLIRAGQGAALSARNPRASRPAQVQPCVLAETARPLQVRLSGPDGKRKRPPTRPGGENSAPFRGVGRPRRGYRSFPYASDSGNWSWCRGSPVHQPMSTPSRMATPEALVPGMKRVWTVGVTEKPPLCRPRKGYQA
jgi:hypothetical protein